MRYKEHRPGYVSGYDTKEVEFTSLDELKNSDTVAGRFFGDHGFDRFALGGVEYKNQLLTLDDFQGYLMAEMKCGEYWVTGYLYGTDDEIKALDLPKWKARDK